ncbi:hypothetical protein UFOVP1082_40 [uncultured Caudovirales phage]|uniref:Uncharacterized protein n=1 Tax=uncultured Caudovirales phage TaxID=2100421 RepID=A0A6J5RN75_9CAUD|nr:hypothetical protein UFOVP906_18 [uncultured Caudovirales phage]CAB4176593.1 hypothetical protein UFOVP992_44 [uncultured Caudovirales phage]CAB4183420.1 hypothetical protein UFOVP1082_40 [uncultured Caudovirales phage]CAB4197492.1 hypothetical protein UFOVP1322_25 [uncultured Caudovirales phage]CAB4212866.1 hypothetical protein UFOVP1434_47 [uncultured Caudovirales phage]
MSRHTTTAVDSALSLPEIPWALLADIGVSSSTMYVCTGNRYIYSNNTYSPVGYLGGVDPIKEEADAFPRGIKMWLSLINSQATYEAFNEQLFNKPVVLYKTVTSYGTVVGTPDIIFKGRINYCGGKTGDPARGNYFELEIESRLRREPKSAYYNRETLWQTYSGDTGANYVDKIPLYKSQWGTIPSPTLTIPINWGFNIPKLPFGGWRP